MQLFGYLKQNLRGEIYRRIMASGVRFIKDLFDGKKKVCEKNYLRYWKMMQILNGNHKLELCENTAVACDGNQAVSKTKGDLIRKYT